MDFIELTTGVRDENGNVTEIKIVSIERFVFNLIQWTFLILKGVELKPE